MTTQGLVLGWLAQTMQFFASLCFGIYIGTRIQVSPIPFNVALVFTGWVIAYFIFGFGMSWLMRRWARANLQQIIEENLVCDQRWRQRLALSVLEITCGSRFGRVHAPRLFGRQRFHNRQCDLWREWWQEHADQLEWDMTLAMYVERRYANA